MMRYRSKISSVAFDIINCSVLCILVIAMLYPCLYVLFASFSDPVELYRGSKILLSPRGFNLKSYQLVFGNPMLWVGYRNTLLYVCLGTAINLLMTSFAAYGLSRRYLPGKVAIMKLIVFTMFFSGGMIPNFLLVLNLGMVDKVWAMVIPTAISTWNFIIMRTYFAGIPASMEESAKIDGAGDFTILFKIIYPLSIPVVVVMILYYSVGHWNSFFNALIYLRKRELYPLQLVLREILIQNDFSMLTGIADDRQAISENVKYATIVLASLPVMLLYPFLQKHFVKGIMIGAIKE